MKLKLLDLFSGIGGFSLGFESTGFFETIGFVEKDKFCQKVLRKHWSNINIEEDIRNVKGERYAADIITGGFPCQPFSVAGKRKGTADDRYLWDEMLRVIREVKPRWVIGENVEGIININNGLVLRQVQTDLENEGFKIQCLVIPASGIGAWHQRKRVWIIANSEHNVSNTNSRNVETRCKRQWGVRKEHKEKGTSDNATSIYETLSNSNARLSIRENKEIQTGRNTINSSSKDVPNSDSRLRRGRGTELKSGDDREWRFYSTQEEQTKQHIRCETIGYNAISGKDVSNSSIKRLQGCSIQHNLEKEQRPKKFITKTSFERQQTWWQTQSKFCGVPNGISYELDKDRTNRIKALGNSIVPQIARQIALAIKEVEKTEYETT